jgi:hypothetical protein
MTIINVLYFSNLQTNKLSQQIKRKGVGGKEFLPAGWLLLTEVRRDL